MEGNNDSGNRISQQNHYRQKTKQTNKQTNQKEIRPDTLFNAIKRTLLFSEYRPFAKHHSTAGTAPHTYTFMHYEYHPHLTKIFLLILHSYLTCTLEGTYSYSLSGRRRGRECERF